MKRKIESFNDSNNKQIKILYIEDITENDNEEYAIATEMIMNHEWEEFAQIIFRFKDGTSKRMKNKK